MGSVKLLKGSEEFEMFQDYWKMMQSVWSVENTKEYWEKAVEDIDRFYRKYQTEFSKELALALANELERKAKHEAEMWSNDPGASTGNETEQDFIQDRVGVPFDERTKERRRKRNAVSRGNRRFTGVTGRYGNCHA